MDKNPPDMYNHIKAHLDDNEVPIPPESLGN
jgi:hypothetical protein